MVAFGEYLKKHQVSEWEEYYINYKRLKQIIKALSTVTFHQRNKMAEERVTSMSMNLNPPEESIVDGKVVTDQDFFALIEAEMHKVDTFTTTTVQSIEARIVKLEDDVNAFDSGHLSSSEEEEATISELSHKAKKELFRKLASDLGDDFLKVEKFANLNFLAVHKILKKHDKNLPTSCQQFYIAKMHQQSWVSGGCYTR